MKKINFEDGTKVSNAKVTIDGVDYTVTPARYTGATPLSAYVMNKLQDNIENTIDQNVNNIGGKDYDATSTYDVGDIVKYQGQLYICTTAITTAEAWNSNHWQATDVLSKSEIYVGTEEPVAGEKVWFNKNKNSIYVRNSNGVYEEFIEKIETDYNPGEELMIPEGVMMPGNLTTDSSEIQCVFMTSKSLKNITNISIKDCLVVLRGINGYLDGDGTGIQLKGASNYTINAKIRNNAIFFSFVRTTKFNTTNNTPAVVYPISFKVILQ